MIWTVIDFQGNKVIVEACDLQDALDEAESHAQTLLGASHTWTLFADSGEVFWASSNYDYENDPYEYFAKATA
ncbi:hypothetical protein BH762_gp045 [Gordonia phage OneUp]|uniref:Uncharacterized protein n=1 Tax=Gordonia phage OneUp TaxID=1838074 RepID=A0A166Y9J9_9CAUD|nr:hypothetical protein BH762_gp045 [Gordonia phage OneUp]ANA86473.1 hypothetical protein PBI_ONEUP_140 [Gordonia phage OneUp]